MLVEQAITVEKAGVAVALLHGKSATLIHNGKEVYRGGPRPNHLAISADGARLAHSASEGGRVRIVADGEGSRVEHGVELDARGRLGELR